MGYALVQAAGKGDKDIVELLINEGADPNSTAWAGVHLLQLLQV